MSEKFTQYEINYKLGRIELVAKNLHDKLHGKIDILDLRAISDIYAAAKEIRDAMSGARIAGGKGAGE